MNKTKAKKYLKSWLCICNFCFEDPGMSSFIHTYNQTLQPIHPHQILQTFLSVTVAFKIPKQNSSLTVSEEGGSKQGQQESSTHTSHGRRKGTELSGQQGRGAPCSLGLCHSCLQDSVSSTCSLAPQGTHVTSQEGENQLHRYA